MIQKNLRISFISSYIPRKCGIATFTNDLVNAIKDTSENDNYSLSITALNDIKESYKYPFEVKFEIKDKYPNDFKEAAYYLNLSDTDVVNIQHEFGLYGGEAGSNILTLYENLKKPIVTTLHTILENPDENYLRVTKEIGHHSSYLIVQSHRSFRMLENIYGIPKEKIRFIPHGAHEVPFLDTVYYKDKFKLAEKKVLFTFGLLSPGKGIEDVIRAMPEVVSKYKDVVYIVLGATHPNVLRNFGESYRDRLEKLVKENGMDDNIVFVNRFVNTPELLEFLMMSDIYISPYHHKEQIVSGTLTYALASGKAIISTPYWHAEELLENDRGVLVPPKDPEKMAEAIVELLTDENRRNRLRKNAYDYGKDMLWKEVGKTYVEVFSQAVEEFKLSSAHIYQSSLYKSFNSLPEVNLAHLKTLTDDTGIYQHAVYSIGNRNEGYCTDDNARALLTVIMNKYLFNDPSVEPLINIYLSFIHHAFNTETGLFRNFLSYDRKWLEDTGSEDCNGRVIFVLGYMIKNASVHSRLSLVKMLFDTSIKNMEDFKSPRSMAQVIIGCVFYLNRFAGAREVKRVLKKLLYRLFEYYTVNSTDDWKWFEKSLTYDNARLSQALIMGGKFIENDKYVKAGLESLSWLHELLLEDKEYLSLIGNNGWYYEEKTKAKYDQQPVEIPALIDAYYRGYAVTQDREWINRAELAFSWLLGNNDRQEPLFDAATGGCYDGLTSTMINENEGAESTISWLLSLQRMIQIERELRMDYKTNPEEIEELNQ